MVDGHACRAAYLLHAQVGGVDGDYGGAADVGGKADDVAKILRGSEPCRDDDWSLRWGEGVPSAEEGAGVVLLHCGSIGRPNSSALRSMN